MLARKLYVLGIGIALALGAHSADATSSVDELVRQARAHEAVREDDVAARRYMEALTLDPASEDAWLGLGALRIRVGEAAEAERVFQAALQRVPTMHRAIQGRAHARWALGRHGEAEGDLSDYATRDGDVEALRELAAAELARAEKSLTEAATIAAPVLGEMRKLNARALHILADAEAAKDRPTALHAIRECRRNLELISRLTGELDPRAAGETPGGPINITVVYAPRAPKQQTTEPVFAQEIPAAADSSPVAVSLAGGEGIAPGGPECQR